MVCAQEHANQLVETLEAPVKEFVQLMKSAKATINDRATALSNLEAVSPLYPHYRKAKFLLHVLSARYSSEFALQRAG